MKITTLQWNIGGGTLLRPNADPALLAAHEQAGQDGMTAIIDLIRRYHPDIITLQETHANGSDSQPKQIAEALGYATWVNHVYADSHVEAGQQLGQGIVSRWPLAKEPVFDNFWNPRLKRWIDGTDAPSHDKGRTRAELDLGNGRLLGVQTSHSLPFRKYGLDLTTNKTAQTILQDMAAKFTPPRAAATIAELTQADLNINAESVRSTLPTLFAQGFEEVVQRDPTNVKGRRYDHILFRGLRLLSSTTIIFGSDHYPIVSEFELSDETPDGS